jgi:membrane-associated phospholipid phosphatase
MPTIVILIVSLLLVPGNTVPKTTSNALIWKRKLWELHVGWLGLLMAVGASFFFISGMKNICGKPRPDMLSRCMPDVANAAKYVIGGYGGKATATTLYSADICKQTDEKLLNDGFRSFPSGHSSSSAAGLIYLSLFLASKFSVTMPFVVSFSAALDDSLHTAFPSRALPRSDPYESARLSNGAGDKARIVNRNALHNTRLQSLRRQAAAPPVYLLVITLVPFCLAIFIACSRWFNYRHHGFDILFGFLIGTITAIYSFRYYHLPITSGAGWAWASRSNDRAFWAGVGRLGFAGDNLDDDYPRPLDPADLGESGDVDIHGTHGGVSSEAGATHRGDRPNAPGAFSFQDVELGRMDQRGQQAAPYGQVP